MNIAICDDHEQYVDRLTAITNQTMKTLAVECCIYPFQSGRELLDCPIPIQVLLLDYRLGEMNGLEVCREFRQQHPDAIVIFVSDYVEAAPAGYELEILGYVLKKELPGKLEKALSKAFRLVQQQQDIFCVPGSSLKVHLKDILYFESNNKTVSLFVQGLEEPVSFRAKLKDVFQQLPPSSFSMIQRSVIVNFRHVKQILHKEVMMKDGKTVFATNRQKYSEIRNAFLQWRILSK